MRISVYITSFNQKEYLKEAIDSVINQTLKPFEIIIIDDCSSDGSQKLINKYVSTHPDWIKPILNSSNCGISYCRRKAIKAATGDYLTWVDGDDCFLPQKLEKESNLLKNDKFQIAFSNFYYANDELENITRIWAYNFNKFPPKGNMFKAVLTRAFPRGSLFRSELINMEVLKNTALYDENLEIYEDYDLRIRLSRECDITYTHEPLSIYRLHNSGLSKAKSEIHYNSFKYIFKKYQKQVEALPDKERKHVKQRMKSLLEEKNKRLKGEQSKHHISIKRKVQLKLINLVNKL